LPLQAVEPKRLYRQIADQLAQLIASGEFPSGSRLPAERELAASLGVSRTSVREAIISLEMTGLVEGEIAALAATVASDEDAEALRRSVERIEASTDDFVARESEDRDFHLLLAKATGNSSLELVVEGLWDQRAELWARIQHHFHTNDLAAHTIRDHAAIVSAVAAHNPEAARAAMHRHLARVAREFQRGIDKTAEARPPRTQRASTTTRKIKGARP
jgi:DNA-binding FadR family transcriptional regulator